jgi:protocatechuate 3,4-dioxygenase, beta subunit
MKTTEIMLLVAFAAMVSLTACSQTSKKDKIVGGRCEGCEAALEYGARELNAVDTLPDFNDPGPKMLVTGTIYKQDGKTPAPNVILYIYHTDQEGIYPKRGSNNNWSQRHGYIRGWSKTGNDGRYAFYTLRPAAYPGREIPEHIHATIKEEGLTPYFIDDYLFDDDPILTAPHRQEQRKRGGNGIIKPVRDKDGLQRVTRDIVLGLNIDGY